MIYSHHLQIREVALLPVVHEDKIQSFQAIVRPQPGDHLIRWVHDEFHLRNMNFSNTLYSQQELKTSQFKKKIQQQWTVDYVGHWMYSEML